MNLKEWATRQGISYTTARRWFRAGRLPLPARRLGGLILVGELAVQDDPGTTVVYAHIGEHEHTTELNRQIVRVTRWCGQHEIPVNRVASDVGDGRKAELLNLLRDPKVATIVVEFRETVGQQAFEYLAAALVGAGRHLLVVDQSDR